MQLHNETGSQRHRAGVRDPQGRGQRSTGQESEIHRAGVRDPQGRSERKPSKAQKGSHKSRWSGLQLCPSHTQGHQ